MANSIGSARTSRTKPFADHRHGLFSSIPRAAIEKLVIIDLVCGSFMFDPGRGFLTRYTGTVCAPHWSRSKDCRIAVIPVKVAGVHADQPAIGYSAPARRKCLWKQCVSGSAKMDHLGPGIGLLHVVGDGDGIEFALRSVAAQDAGRYFQVMALPVSPASTSPLARASRQSARLVTKL